MTGEAHRKVIYRLYKLPQVTIHNEKQLLHDGEVFDIDGIRIECFLVPGHTWGHMVYLVDDKYLFTGDTLWFGADGGYSFISSLAEDNKLAVKSLALLEKKLKNAGCIRCSLPVTQVGRTTWSLPLRTKMSCARLSRKEPTTPMRFTIPMMNPMILRKTQKAGT